MRQLLEVQTLQAVLMIERRRNPTTPSAQDFAYAINYYLEMDTFYEPDAE